MSLATVESAFKKNNRIEFLLELDFNGALFRFSTAEGGTAFSSVKKIHSDVVGLFPSDSLLPANDLYPRSGGLHPPFADTDIYFDGKIDKISPIGNTFDLQSFRHSVCTVAIDIENSERFQDYEKQLMLESGKGKIWAWTPPLQFCEIEAYPIFVGLFKSKAFSKYIYSFELLDFSYSSGATLSDLSITGHPADLSRWLLEGFTSLNIDEIETSTFKYFQQKYPIMNGCEMQINNAANTFDIINRLMIQCKMVLNPQIWGKMGILDFDLESPVIEKLNDDDFLESFIKFEHQNKQNISNDYYIAYNYNSNTQLWDNYTLVNKDLNDSTGLCKRSYFKYGALPQVQLLLSDCVTVDQAAWCAQQHIKFFSNQHYLIKLTMTYARGGWALMPGHVVELTLKDAPGIKKTGWVDEKAIILQKKYNRHSVSFIFMKI